MLALCEEHEKKETEHPEREKRKKEEDEAKGARVRESAMTSLGKRKTADEDRPHVKSTYGTMVRMLTADTDKELVYKRDELEISRQQVEWLSASRTSLATALSKK